nr:hypothetical protein [uncultured Prevotella sp.]
MKKFYFLTLFAMLFCCLGINAAAELTFSNVSLAPGSQVATLAQDQQITFNTNMDSEIGYMLGEIKDETKGEIVLSSTTVYDPNFNNNGDGTVTTTAPQTKKEPHFTFVCHSATKMIEGHTYSLYLYAYADKASAAGKGELLATGSIKYVGATPAYIGSRFKLLNITPDLNSYIIKGTAEELQNDASKRSVTLNFSGMVTLDEATTFVNTGSGTSEELEAITPGADKQIVTTEYPGGEKDVKIYSTSWTLTVKFSTMSDGTDVLLSANAYDKAGLHVSEGTEYSTGADEFSYYSFTVSNDYGKKDFTLTPTKDDKYLNSLYSFVVEGGKRGISVAGIPEQAVVYRVADNGEKTEVATVSNTNVKIGTLKDPESGDEVPKQVRIFLSQPINKAGNYVVSFPRNYFIYGSNMFAEGCPAMDFEYTIKEDLPEYTVKVLTPTGKISKLKTIELQVENVDEVGENPDTQVPAYLFDEKNQLVTTASLELGNEWNSVKYTLKQEVTKPGKYTLVVPQDAIVVPNTGANAKPSTKTAKGGADLSGGDGDSELEYTWAGAIIKEFTVEAGSIDAVTAKLSIEDNATVDKIESLQVTFEGAESVSYSSGTPFWMATNNKKNNRGSITETEGNVATVYPSADMWDPSTITAADTYTLTLPAGYFIVNGAAWPEIVLHVTVDPDATGINSIEGAAAKAKNVYTLEGVKVNGSTDNLKGTFIVDGKKVNLK